MQVERTEQSVRPNEPLSGEAAIPPSKSIAQRALIWAAAGHGDQIVRNCGDSADVRATLASLSSLGVRTEKHGNGEVLVAGGSALNWSSLSVPVGESGTLARLLLGLVGTRSGARVALQPEGSLRGRTPSSLIRALERLGARVRGSGYALTVEGAATSPPWQLSDPASSQDVSALLGGLASRGGGRLVVTGAIPSRPYVELSISVLKQLGVTIHHSGGVFDVAGELTASSNPIVVEPDASSAAVALCAAATSGGDVCVRGLDPGSLQGDVGILGALQAFGVSTSWQGSELRAWGAPTQGAVLDLASMPDLAPPLVAVAARAAWEHGVTSELRGLATLRGKESDRVDTLARSFEQLGFAIDEPLDALRIGPRGGTRANAKSSGSDAAIVFDPRGDHRIAFALSLVGTFLREVQIRNSACVAKSWPGYWRSLADLGGAVT